MAGTEVKDAGTPATPEKQAKIDHAKDAATKEIQTMPASTQREAVTKEWQRVASQCGPSLPELAIGHDKDKQVAVISTVNNLSAQLTKMVQVRLAISEF